MKPHGDKCLRDLAPYVLNPEDDRCGIWLEKGGPCFWCGGPSHRLDLCYEGWLHYTCCPAVDDDCNSR